MQSSECPRLRAIETAFKKTSGITTALPILSQTPPAIRATTPQSDRKSSRAALPIAAPSSAGVMCTMSVPIATWTVSGTLARCAATRSDESRPGPPCSRMMSPSAKPNPVECASRAVARPREEIRRLARKAELALHEPAADILAGLSGDRQLEIVDRRRTVEREPGEDSPVDPIDQIDSATRLDDVTAKRRDNRPARTGGADDRVTKPPQRISAQHSEEGYRANLQTTRSPCPGRPWWASDTLLGRSSSGS